MCVCASVCKQLKHFDIPMSVSSGAKSVGGSDQTHAGSLQALTLLFSIHLSPLLFFPLLCPSSFSSTLSATSVSLFTSTAFHLHFFLSHSLCLALLSITLLLSPHPFFSCGWWMLMNLWISAWGGPLPRETKNDFTARCVEYGLVEEQGGSSKHQTTVLFWSILCHRGSGPPEIEHKVAFLVEDV